MAERWFAWVDRKLARLTRNVKPTLQYEDRYSAGRAVIG